MRRCLPVLVLAVALGATACSSDSGSSAQRDDAGAVATAGAVDAFDVEVGDCVDEPQAATEGVEEIESVQAVPCGEPHDGEVYAAFDLPDSDYPGDDEVSAAGEDRCVEEFETFVGASYDDSKYDITSLFPTRESWESQGDREYVCIVVAPVGEKVTGTLKGAAE